MSILLPDTIKFIITDFDGIVTDNCVYIDSAGNMTRKLNFKDIMAFSILKKQGYRVGIVSGESNSAIDLINKKFNIDEIHQGIRVKIDIIRDIVERYGLKEDEYIYIGDDINDFETLSSVKYPITVPNAVEKVKEIDGIQITSACGGEGAFREIVDAILN